MLTRRRTFGFAAGFIGAVRVQSVLTGGILSVGDLHFSRTFDDVEKPEIKDMGIDDDKFAQSGYFKIFLSFRFYVKTILENLELQKVTFLLL